MVEKNYLPGKTFISSYSTTRIPINNDVLLKIQPLITKSSMWWKTFTGWNTSKRKKKKEIAKVLKTMIKSSHKTFAESLGSVKSHYCGTQTSIEICWTQWSCWWNPFQYSEVNRMVECKFFIHSLIPIVTLNEVQKLQRCARNKLVNRIKYHIRLYVLLRLTNRSQLFE